ncbi:MAG: zinc-ribbon domain-containing protein [Myxococcales bacterium]|nr:zinc-ribbon domain-containing protein [Myxococcales bacterium]
MDVRCERCATEYELDDDAVPAGGCPVQCATCGHTFTVSRVPAAAMAEAALPSPPAAEWLLETSDGRLHRFRNLTSLQKWIIERKVTREDKISRTGQAWRRLGEIVELAPFFDVVDEADRARAARATVDAQSLKSEAERARRIGSPRPSPAAVASLSAELPDRGATAAPAPHKAPPAPRKPPPAPELEALDRWSAGGDTPTMTAEEEPSTAVVPVRRTGILVFASLVVAAGIGAVVWLKGPGVLAPKSPAPPPAGTTASTLALPQTLDRPPEAARPAPPRPAPPPAVAAPPSAPPVAVVPPPAPRADEGAGAIAEPTHYEPLVAAADRLLENGAPDRAFRLYDKALKQKPQGAEALAGLGYVMLDKSRPKPALGFFERALAEAPSYGPALFGMGEALRAEGRVDQAIEMYRRYLQVNAAGEDAPAARRQLQVLEDRAEAASPSGLPSAPAPAAYAPPSTPPPSPASVLSEPRDP